VVAERLGKPPSYVAKYEGGERRLDVLEFLDVAAAIGFDPSISTQFAPAITEARGTRDKLKRGLVRQRSTTRRFAAVSP
jgi:hypothetical protein